MLERLLLRVEPRRLGCSGDEFRDAVRSAVDHEAKLGRYEGPLLVLHAEQDHLVRIRHAEQNLATASSDQKRLVRFPRGDHNSILMENQRAYVEELAQFVAAL